MKSHRAITLLELLVGMGLSALILTIGVNLIWQAMRTSARGATSGELYQSGLTCISWLMEDLQSTSSAGLGILNSNDSTTPTVLSVHPLIDVSDQLVRFYDDHLIVYAWTPAIGALTRSQWPPEPPALERTFDPAEALRPTPEQLLSLATARGEQRKLAGEVTDFRIENPAGVTLPNIGQPLLLRLSLARKAAAGYKPETFQYNRTVVLRNQL